MFLAKIFRPHRL